MTSRLNSQWMAPCRLSTVWVRLCEQDVGAAASRSTSGIGISIQPWYLLLGVYTGVFVCLLCVLLSCCFRVWPSCVEWYYQLSLLYILYKMLLINLLLSEFVLYLLRNWLKLGWTRSTWFVCHSFITGDLTCSICVFVEDRSLVVDKSFPTAINKWCK